MHIFFLQTSNDLVLPPLSAFPGDVSCAPGHNRNVPVEPPPQAEQVQTLHGEASNQTDGFFFTKFFTKPMASMRSHVNTSSLDQRKFLLRMKTQLLVSKAVMISYLVAFSISLVSTITSLSSEIH